MTSCRNGSVKQIKDIVSHLNDAKLDPNTGIHTIMPSLCFAHSSNATPSPRSYLFRLTLRFLQ